MYNAIPRFASSSSSLLSTRRAVGERLFNHLLCLSIQPSQEPDKPSHTPQGTSVHDESTPLPSPPRFKLGSVETVSWKNKFTAIRRMRSQTPPDQLKPGKNGDTSATKSQDSPSSPNNRKGKGKAVENDAGVTEPAPTMRTESKRSARWRRKSAAGKAAQMETRAKRVKSKRSSATKQRQNHVSERWQGEPWAKSGEPQPSSQHDPEGTLRDPLPHLVHREPLKQGEVDDSSKPILTDVAPINEHLPVDTLSHGLDRVLFNPGVHWLQDPRSRVYNFTPWLEKIPKVNNFAFERLTGFVSSSRDEDLRELAKQEKRKFAGSTSSLSGMLSHIYFLLSEYQGVDLSPLSQHFVHKSTDFTPGQKMAASVLLNYKDGVYAIDSLSPAWDDADKNILTWLGTVLENFLTKRPEDFKGFMRQESSPQKSTTEESLKRPAFRFAKSKDFVMRSQLDCQDTRLPGTGVFDIKTRACVSIRMDILNFEESAGYLIKTQHGILESFEKEYYDLVRSAFLKYSFQVRIGNMDGVMVAYHNTERIFGFQYIPITEMDERLFGPHDGLGDKIFNKCVTILEETIAEAAACFPGESVKCLFETLPTGKVMNVFVQPANWDGPAEEWPLKCLYVTVEHELDGEPASARRCMSGVGNWVTKYHIGLSTLPRDSIQYDLASAERRKKRTLVLPSHVPIEKAREFWDSLNFSNKDTSEEAKAFDPTAFSLATNAVERYRILSREGRRISEQMEREQAGLPKIVLGEGVYIGDILEDMKSSQRHEDVRVESRSKGETNLDREVMS